MYHSLIYRAYLNFTDKHLNLVAKFKKHFLKKKSVLSIGRTGADEVPLSPVRFATLSAPLSLLVIAFLKILHIFRSIT
jgi:hypothetical protein